MGTYPPAGIPWEAYGYTYWGYCGYMLMGVLWEKQACCVATRHVHGAHGLAELTCSAVPTLLVIRNAMLGYLRSARALHVICVAKST